MNTIGTSQKVFIMRGVHLIEVLQRLNCCMHTKVNMTISMITQSMWSSLQMNQRTKPIFSSSAWFFLQSLFERIFHVHLLEYCLVDAELSELRVQLRNERVQLWLSIDILHLSTSVQYELFSLSRINSVFSERVNVCFIIISLLQIDQCAIASPVIG